MNNNVLAGIAAIAVIGVGLALIAKPNAPITVNTPVNVESPARSFGAVSSLDSPLDVNGARLYMQGMSFRTGSSTVCALKTPNASTTALAITGHLNGGVAHTQTYQWAYSSTLGATTTDLGKILAESSGKHSSVASTTGVVFPPNNFIILKMATTTGTTISTSYAPLGGCMFELVEV